jgi:hypothetical protein
MGNNTITITPQTDGVSMKFGCKNVRFTHSIGVRNKRVNQPMTPDQTTKHHFATKKYKAAITQWAADGGEGKAPTKPRKPTTKYKYVDYMGFEIKMKAGYDQAYISSDDLLKMSDALLSYYEEVVEYEKLATKTLDVMEKAYKADKKAGKRTAKPTVATVRARLIQAEVANAAG